MTRPFLLVVVLSLFVAACGGGSSEDGADGLVVEDGDLVAVHYDGTLDDGSTFDSSRERETPFEFTVGTGQVIPGFDAAVRGLAVGDTTTVRIEAADAYGERTEEAIITVPYAESQGDVSPGDEVTLSNGLPAVVVSVNDDAATVTGSDIALSDVSGVTATLLWTASDLDILEAGDFVSITGFGNEENNGLYRVNAVTDGSADVERLDGLTLVDEAAGAEVTVERSGTVTLDANHPLAGEALTFDIEILSITREQ